MNVTNIFLSTSTDFLMLEFSHRCYLFRLSYLQLMVHVGVSGIAKQLTLEQCAHNDGYDKMDNERCIPSKNCCVDGARACISSKLDMKKVCNAINDDNCGIEAVISHDPGRLVQLGYFNLLIVQ